MVLLMVTNVVAKSVERTVVAGGLLSLCGRRLALSLLLRLHAREDVVFGNKMGGARMQAASQEAGDDKVEQGVHADGADDEVVEEELRGKVGGVPARELLGADETWSQGVEEDLEGAVGRSFVSPFEVGRR